MIDVDQQINAVRRTVGGRTLEAGEARVVTISQSYDTDAADLWDACTNIERIPRWFLPITGDLRVGGHYQLEGNANGTILTCDPPREFTATWECGDDVSWIEVRIIERGLGPVTVRTATHRARRRPLGAVRPWRGRHGLRRRTGRSDHPSVDGRGRRPVVRSRVDGVRRRPPIHEALRRGVVRGQRGRRAPTRTGRGPPPIAALPPTWEKTRTRSSQRGRAGDILVSMHAQTPVQIAWVTKDLDATEKALTTLLGAKKWIRVPDVHFGPDTCTYRGRPADFVAHISFSYAGDTQLELIAPVSGESVYTEFLDRAGPGLHHICVEVDDVEKPSARRRRPRRSCSAASCPAEWSSPTSPPRRPECPISRSRTSRPRSGRSSIT